MNVLSVNVGTPSRLDAGTRQVVTAIVKKPVSGRVAVRRLHVEGDFQADLRVHGGPNKAVYLYPAEHYDYWRAQLPDMELEPGMFGENLTTAGLLETEAFIGDRLRVGTALLEVRQPRMPCFKLALRFGRADMVKRFWASERCGVYLSVVEEGTVAAGDTIDRVQSGSDVSIAEVVSLYRNPLPPKERVQAAVSSTLAGSWKRELQERLTAE